MSRNEIDVLLLCERCQMIRYYYEPDTSKLYVLFQVLQ